MNLFVPVIMALAALLLAPLPNAEGHARATIDPPVLRRISCCCSLMHFCSACWAARCSPAIASHVSAGAASRRYHSLPPCAVLAGSRRFIGGRICSGLFVNPPYGFAPEDNLEYARVVRMQLSGIAQLEHRYPGAAVLTAWPMTDELTRPELGYVKRPWDRATSTASTTSPRPRLPRLQRSAKKYSAALVFSTKYDPPSPLLTLGARASTR